MWDKTTIQPIFIKVTGHHHVGFDDGASMAVAALFKKMRGYGKEHGSSLSDPNRYFLDVEPGSVMARWIEEGFPVMIFFGVEMEKIKDELIRRNVLVEIEKDEDEIVAIGCEPLDRERWEQLAEHIFPKGEKGPHAF